MGLREGCFARVWSAKVSQYSVNSYVTVSKAKRDDNNNPLKDDNGKTVYEQQFNGFVTFAGDAKAIIEGLGLPETIDRDNPVSKTVKIVGSPDITSWYDAEKKKGGTNIRIRDVELPESNGETASKPAKKAASTAKKSSAKKESVSSDDELPF